MEYFLYLLYSKTVDRYYIGHTQDIVARLERHNSGKVKSTREKGPWKVVYSEAFATRAEANQRERYLKRMKSRKLLESLMVKTRPD